MGSAVWIQAIGFAGIAVNTLVYQQKTRLHMLLCKLSSDIIWFVHYLLLGAYGGAAVAAIGCLRESVFITRWGEKHKHIAALVFMVILLLSAAATWRGAMSLLPATASSMAVYSFAEGRPRLTRLLSLPISACMLTYGVLCGSVAALVGEILSLTSAVIGIWRYDVRHDGRRRNIKEEKS